MRINVDSLWFIDPRRKKLTLLVGSEFLADGIALHFWHLGASYYSKARHGIPTPVFDMSEYSKEFEEAGLATRDSEFIYIKGQNERIMYVEKRREAGQRGGLKTQEQNRQKIRFVEIIEESVKQNQANESKFKPLSLSLPLSLKKEEYISSKSETFEREIENIYLNHYPRKEGKTNGIKTLRKQIKSEADLADLERAVKNYAQLAIGQEKRFIKMFSSFASCWRDYLTPEFSQPATAHYNPLA